MNDVDMGDFDMEAVQTSDGRWVAMIDGQLGLPINIPQLYADHVALLRKQAQASNDDEVTYRIRDARMIAGLFLDWLQDSDSVDFCGKPHNIQLCHRNSDYDWQPYSPNISGPSVEAVIGCFIEWCQES